MRTDVTPYRDNNINIVPPYQRVYSKDDIGNEKPECNSKGGNIAGAPMPGEDDEDWDGWEESDGGKFGMHDGRKAIQKARKKVDVLRIGIWGIFTVKDLLYGSGQRGKDQ